MRYKNLILFTSSFPYGTGEEFLETEILYLSKAFSKVIIYTSSSKGEVRNVPDNVFVKTISFNNEFSVKKVFINNFFTLMNILYYEIILSKKRIYFLRNIVFFINEIFWKLNHVNQIYKEIKSWVGPETLFYTYWFDNWASYLSIIKIKYFCDINYITRIHGFDYEPSRRNNMFIPFRCFEMHQVKAIYSVSAYGVRIIKNEYPFFKKISISRLGVNEKGVNPFKSGETFELVSCSSIIPLKRIHLIVEILEKISFPINWVHFGDGIEMSNIQEKIKKLPSNITVKLKGSQSNNYVISYYHNNPIDLFINVSKFEGVPVSIMEAMSFGIPCIGCDVGGVSEIVNNETGFLFKKDFHPNEISQCIELYYRKSEQEKIVFRNTVKLFWEKNYNAEKNYIDFIKTMAPNQIV